MKFPARFSLRSAIFFITAVAIILSLLVFKSGFQGLVYGQPVWVSIEGNEAEYNCRVRVVHNGHDIALGVLDRPQSLDFAR